MPCIESKFDSRTLTPCCFSNALISFGSRYSDQLKYTRSPSISALTARSVCSLLGCSWLPTPQAPSPRPSARPAPPWSSSRRFHRSLLIPNSPHSQPQAVPPHDVRRDGGIAQRELDRVPVQHRSQQERLLVGVVSSELPGRLSVADHLR